MKIIFIENSDIEYDASDRYNNKLRGGETVLINLAEQLTSFGHEVHIFNKCQHNQKEINKVFWSNIDLLKNKKISNECEIAIVQADANNLKYVNSKKNFLISHSIQNLEKFLRKRQFFAFLKYKPKVIVASNYHYNKRSFFTSMYGKIKLFWSVDNIFTKTPLNDQLIKKKAIFTTRPDRNLDLLIKIWNNKIYPFSKESSLFINPPYNVSKHDKNIFLRELGDQQNLVNDLLSTKVMLVPGHKSEVFCLAAQEAAEMCIPIVTLGIGALSERVEHNKSGYVAKNQEEFANYALILLNDNNKWNEMRNYLLNKRGKVSWKSSAIILNKELYND